MIVHYFTLTEEANGVLDVGIVDESEDVVVGYAGLLLSRQVFVEVGDGVALDADIFHIEGNARGGNGVHANRVVNEIVGKGGVFDFVLGKICGKLMNYGGDHFHMSDFFGAYLTFKIVYDIIRETTLKGVITYGNHQKLPRYT